MELTLRDIMGLAPFDPKKNKPVALPGGSFATEYSQTVQDDNGEWMVAPQIWWDQSGAPRYLEGDQGRMAAIAYELMGNKPFKRFPSSAAADGFASYRSRKGGGNSGL